MSWREVWAAMNQREPGRFHCGVHVKKLTILECMVIIAIGFSLLLLFHCLGIPLE